MSVMLMGVGCPVATGLQHRVVITPVPDLTVPYPFGPAQALAAVKLLGIGSSGDLGWLFISWFSPTDSVDLVH